VAPHFSIGQFVSKQSGAADIYVDDDGDGTMDDLDGDGKTTLDDARALAAVIENLSQKSWYQPFEGGLGPYRRTAVAFTAS
jgi:hypothetical protein